MYDLILKNGTLVNEGSIYESDVAIKGDRIEKISSSIDSEAKKIIDLDGKYILPGLIDDQVHFREPGLTHKGNIQSESRAGLAGGVTSILKCLMLIQPQPIERIYRLNLILQQLNRMQITLFIWVQAIQTLMKSNN